MYRLKGFLSKRPRKSAISKHCQSTYHDTLTLVNLNLLASDRVEGGGNELLKYPPPLYNEQRQVQLTDFFIFSLFCLYLFGEVNEGEGIREPVKNTNKTETVGNFYFAPMTMSFKSH